MAAQLAFTDARGGMNAADEPNRIAPNQLARMVNCRLEGQLPTTRCGVRVIPLSGDLREVISAGNVQGSIFFNPAMGQGGIILSKSNSMIATAATGRKFVVKITGARASTVAKVEEIAPGLFTDEQLHLAWICGWENNLLFNDGQSNCLIWDGATARFSNGYNTVQKESSEVPNGGTVMVYAHGRGSVVVNSRAILTGNSLHALNQSKSIDLLKFSEQTYWATGAYFMPPSEMGGINAAAILPQRNTQHGHSDVMFHCRGGIFSVEFNVYPRASWIATPMVKHAMLGAGAVGPYALDISDGDQFFRTLKGIQSLRSSAAESELEGNPNQPFSHEVDTWLKADYPRWLRFASLVLWDTARRSLCTTGPIVQGRYRWHRGIISRNVDPKETEKGTAAAWEGLWTLPPEIGGVIQMVRGEFDGGERVFAWCRAGDGRNRLVEFVPWLTEDVLEDGSTRAIRSQAITREIDAGKWWQKREFTTARLYLRNITGPVRWGVWVRTNRTTRWEPMVGGTIAFEKAADNDLTKNEPHSLPIALGTIPEKCCAGRIAYGLQFLVRWEGPCSVEGVRVECGETDKTSDDADRGLFKVEFAKIQAGDYDDFEYATNIQPTYFP